MHKVRTANLGRKFGPRKLSEETKRKISIARRSWETPRWMIERMAEANRGRKLSPEHIEKLRARKMSPKTRESLIAANTGRKITEETRTKMSSKKSRKVRCLNDGLVFGSTQKAAEHYHLNQTNVATSARVGSKIKGLSFEYLDPPKAKKKTVKCEECRSLGRLCKECRRAYYILCRDRKKANP